MSLAVPEVRLPSHGVTGATSLEGPTPEFTRQSKLIREELQSRDLFEDENQLKHRKEVLATLTRVVREWVTEVGQFTEKKSLAEAMQGGGKIFTFGSYELGIASPNSDIDALCVVPKYVTRESFFDALYLKLRELPNMVDLTRVPDAFTPIMTFKLDGIEVDLLFASLNVDRVGDDFTSLSDDNLLRGLDDSSVRSVNGCRVAARMLELVPDKETFSMTLRLIKVWAGARGVYSNVLGYFGGITWALLVARVCQMYPKATPAQLALRFFETFSTWEWGLENPVILCPVEDKTSLPGFSKLKPWIAAENSMHIMPILTPAYPCMNSTHNVSEATKRVIIEELTRGRKIVELILKNKAEWKHLLTPLPFFRCFPAYLQIQLETKTEAAMQDVRGYVESKLRFLLASIQRCQGWHQWHLRPWTKPLELPSEDPNFKCRSGFYFGMKPVEGEELTEEEVDFSQGTHDFLQLVLGNKRAPDNVKEHLKDHALLVNIAAVTPSELPSELREVEVKAVTDKAAEEKSDAQQVQEAQGGEDYEEEDEDGEEEPGAKRGKLAEVAQTMEERHAELLQSAAYGRVGVPKAKREIQTELAPLSVDEVVKRRRNGARICVQIV